MNTKLLFTTILLLGVIFGYSQTNFPVKFRSEKMATSMPITPLEDMFFKKYYYTKPVTIDFSKTQLNIVYDNGKTYMKKDLKEVAHVKEVYDEELEYETTYFVDNTNTADTISFVYDHQVGYYQVIFPKKNKAGESVGYVSYIHFFDDNGMVSK